MAGLCATALVPTTRSDGEHGLESTIRLETAARARSFKLIGLRLLIPSPRLRKPIHESWMQGKGSSANGSDLARGYDVGRGAAGVGGHI